MLTLRIKAIYISLIPLSIFYEILGVVRIKTKRKQTHYLKITSKSKYYLSMMEVLREAQVLANENLTFKTKSNIEKH